MKECSVLCYRIKKPAEQYIFFSLKNKKYRNSIPFHN